MIQRRWEVSISIGRPSLGDSEELQRLDAMERVVRAGIHARGLRVVAAEIARRGLLADHRLAPAGVLGILALHGERVQVDVAVRALVGAEAAADAPVLDDDLERVLMAADRADRAAHHAERV